MTLANWQTGYCTNIHAGVDFPALCDNLRQYAAKVRELVNNDQPLGVGLWIPQDASEHLLTGEAGGANSPNCRILAETLQNLGLKAYTINGFPYGNFHQAVVKHSVYQPTWAEQNRQQFTERLIAILHQLLDEGEVGSISTLPLGWSKCGDEFEKAAAERLGYVAVQLRQLEESTGRRIVVAIEPEPGCTLDTSADIVQFFDRHLASEIQRRYLTVCHDICHAAVMNEPQRAVLKRYADNGLTVGKIQVSSAIEVRWQEMDEATGQAALRQLSRFAEDRYLHQTGVVDEHDNFLLYEDLPQLLGQTTGKPRDKVWRIHFHVPLFLDTFGHLRATKQDVLDCLQALDDIPSELRVPHLEVETYAWSVLPESMRNTGLAESIASELIWLNNTLQHST